MKGLLAAGAALGFLFAAETASHSLGASSAPRRPAAEPGYQKEYTLPVYPQSIGELPSHDVVPFSLNELGPLIPPKTRSITPVRLGLRTITDDALDSTALALTNEGLIGPCRDGQRPITWIRSFTLHIQKKGAPDTRARIARFELPAELWDRPDVCGVAFEANREVNLLGYMPEAEAVIDIEGVPAPEGTRIGGFARVLYDGLLPPPIKELPGEEDFEFPIEDES